MIFFSFHRTLPTQKLSKPIVVPVFIGSYWCPAGDDTAAGATFTTEALSLQILLRDISASWDIHFFLLKYMFLQPGFTLASHCITLTNSSYTQAGIEQTLNNWTTSGTLPGFMQKNYVGYYRTLKFFLSHTYIITDMHVNVRIYTG